MSRYIYINAHSLKLISSNIRDSFREIYLRIGGYISGQLTLVLNATPL